MFAEDTFTDAARPASGLVQGNIHHYENFPVASLLCPAHLRAPIVAIYRFARTADDLADEGDATPAQRLQDLQSYRSDLTRLEQSLSSSGASAASPVSHRWPHVFGPLRMAMARHELPAQCLHALLSAFEQDLTHTRYATREELMHYCERSANPVGRLLLHLYGIKDEDALRQSDAICTALQLANFWQDLSIDLPRGRIYLPEEDRRRHGVGDDELLDAFAPDRWGRAVPAPLRERTAACVRDCCVWARSLFDEGRTLPPKVRSAAGWRAGLELALVIEGGAAILQKIRRAKFDTLSRRPTIGALDILPMLLATLSGPKSTSKPIDRAPP
jgi:squalene synthase HpnC